MKKIIIIVLAASLLICPIYGKANADRQLVAKFCKENYKGYKVKYHKKLPFDALVSRKGKNQVIVEVIKSKSRGKYGLTTQGYFLKYNKKVKKGKSVTSYLIYNPDTNTADDVIAVVDNGIIRCWEEVD